VGPIVAAGVVIAGIFLVARWLGGAKSELEEALETIGQTYIPDLEMQGMESGRLGRGAQQERPVPVRLGRCHGWVATTDEPSCDLDLYLYDGPWLLTADILVDNVPVVFHCADSDRELRLSLANAGAEGCRYGLATYEGRGSVGWPLEPYLSLYASYLSALRRDPPFEPVSEIGHGVLAAAQVEELVVRIPGGRCYNVLAVVQQGSDLNLRLLVDGRVVAEDAGADNFPIVGFCASEADVTATVQVEMRTGGGAYVHQLLEGRPL
jgi:hypothetical protein